jgi:hypothetical protein
MVTPRRRVLLLCLLATLLLSTCGLVEPGLPVARLNGVEGRPVSYCWNETCADGALGQGTASRLPRAGEVLLTFSSGSVIEVQAAVLKTAQDLADRTHRVDIRADGTLVIPPGDWRYVTVYARFEGGGDALYEWLVEGDDAS